MLKQNKRCAFWYLTLYLLYGLEVMHIKLNDLVLTALTHTITIFQCNRYCSRKNACGSFLPTPEALKILKATFVQWNLKKYLHQNIIIMLVKSCQNRHKLHLMCISFRWDEKHRSQTPKDEDNKKESITADLLFVSTANSLKVLALENCNYNRQNYQNCKIHEICITLSYRIKNTKAGLKRVIRLSFRSKMCKNPLSDLSEYYCTQKT